MSRGHIIQTLVGIITRTNTTTEASLSLLRWQAFARVLAGAPGPRDHRCQGPACWYSQAVDVQASTKLILRSNGINTTIRSNRTTATAPGKVGNFRPPSAPQSLLPLGGPQPKQLNKKAKTTSARPELVHIQLTITVMPAVGVVSTKLSHVQETVDQSILTKYPHQLKHTADQRLVGHMTMDFSVR